MKFSPPPMGTYKPRTCSTSHLLVVARPGGQAHPESAVAVNLKACNHFRLYNGRAAEAELKVLADQGLDSNANDLIRHNQVHI